MYRPRIVSLVFLCLTLATCQTGSDDGAGDQGSESGGGDGDGDGTSGDGDGPAGDGDGDGSAGDGDGTPGDGDGTPGPEPLDGPFQAPGAPFCGVFHFDANFGPDFAAALMVLDAQVAMSYPVYYLQADMIPAPVYDYYHNEVMRDFWVISVLDSEGGLPLQSLSDILDSEGNHYWIDWCPD